MPERERFWGLPSDYPMVAPAYAERRSALAKENGLGRKLVARPEPVPQPEPVAEAAPAQQRCTGGRRKAAA